MTSLYVSLYLLKGEWAVGRTGFRTKGKVSVCKGQTIYWILQKEFKYVCIVNKIYS